MVSWLEEHSARKLLGCGPSARLLNSRLIYPRYIRRCATKIEELFKADTTLRALICPQSQLAVSVMELLKTRRRVNYVTWIMDDHVVYNENGRWTYPSGFRETWAKHLRGASKIFVISAELGQFYRREFGVESEVLFGPADPVGEPIWVAPNSGDICRLGYFGSLWSWQVDALTRLARYLSSLNATLDIFTNFQELPLELQVSGVSMRRPVGRADVIHEMRKYDAVVLPIGFLESHRQLTEFNIATKMSECLASGTITLVIGPQNAAMVRHLAPTGAACLTTAGDLAELHTAIGNLKHENYRREVLNRARKLVQLELSTSIMHARWMAAVYQLADLNNAPVNL